MIPTNILNCIYGSAIVTFSKSNRGTLKFQMGSQISIIRYRKCLIETRLGVANSRHSSGQGGYAEVENPCSFQFAEVFVQQQIQLV